jgi:hypothetical protein
MTRAIFAGLFALSLASCAVVRVDRPRSSSAAVTSDEDCPPGHRWSDGKCHATGKGHDPEKKKGKK